MLKTFLQQSHRLCTTIRQSKDSKGVETESDLPMIAVRLRDSEGDPAIGHRFGLGSGNGER